ncbi:beta-lactamase family protein [Lacticaseibacillus casei]|uniref:Serine hydrolase domain-containing protein n=2 Tax=Lacticaseibacillus TaxID=2759736 RepID=A0ABD7Z6Z4_LACZE|nr:MULTISPECIES: serine hydrolase domain-containing protein [Lacticaseibacillus]OFS00697.1 serine hydrolase [Lactobacillus sp. HMSC068F07]MDE3282747.1 beta-lactamase family protein [Lacticaseibacillus casei]MDE3315546.1 beta-lactamase family protein [Lacticaseibacillus zeae]MDG3060462.1 serine hydrolase [Lacticaseibacillus sp. BCRC 81376]QVI37485.1 beta-lactamase family protein [Lacticaseibacillus casei]
MRHRWALWLGIVTLSALLLGAVAFVWQKKIAIPDRQAKVLSSQRHEQATHREAVQTAATHFDERLDRPIDTSAGKSFKETLTNDKFIGSALIIKQGEIIFNGGVGYADAAAKRVNGPTTLFQIGSIQKAVTAVAVMQLAEEGKLHLDDPVGKYLSGIKTGDQVTLRMMIDMRSGFALKKYQPSVMDDAGIIRWAIGNMTYLPQRNYAYQAVNYQLLAGVVEKVAGRSYEQQIRKTIIDRLGLRHTGFLPGMLTDTNRSLTYTGPVTNPYQTSIGEPELWYNRELGTGNMYTTVADLYRLLRGIDDGKVLPLSALKTLRNRDDGVYTAGIYNHSDFYSTNGTVAGQMASTAISHDGKDAVILLSNYNSHALNLHDEAVRLFQTLRQKG